MTDFSIEPLSDYPQHTDTVIGWLFDEWEIDRSDSLSWLSPSEDRPGALLAILEARPIGVLAYKRSQAGFQSVPELWVNALLVSPEFRRRGVATTLVMFGSQASYVSPATRLFVYTNIPQLYFPCGWRELHKKDEAGSHTLTLQIATIDGIAES